MSEMKWEYSKESDEYTGPTAEQLEKIRQNNYKKFMYQRMLETPEQWYKREIEDMLHITKGCIEHNPSSMVTTEMLLVNMLEKYESIKQQHEVVKKYEPERQKQIEHVQKLLEEINKEEE